MGFGCGDDDHSPTNPHRLEACATESASLNDFPYAKRNDHKEEELEKIKVFHGVVAAVARPQF